MVTQLSLQGQEPLRISYLREQTPHLIGGQSDKTLGTGLAAGNDGLAWIETFDNLTDFIAKTDAIAEQYSEVIDWRHGEPTRTGELFHSQAKSPNGFTVAFNPPTEDEPGKARIEFKGSVLRRASFITTLEVIKSQLESGARIQRLDNYIDDYLKRLNPDTIERAISEGNYSGFRVSRSIKNPATPGKGFTLYFGSRQSEKYVRFYDKDTDSKGEIKAYRLEVEWKGKKAHVYARHLIDNYNLCVSAGWDVEKVISLTIAQTVVGSVDFVNRERDENGAVKEKHRDRLERLDWWQEFIDRVGEEIRYSVPRAKATLQKTVDWLYRSVTTPLAKCVKVLGVDLAYDLIAQGLEKLSNPYSKSGATHRATLKTTELEMHNPMIPRLVMQC